MREPNRWTPVAVLAMYNLVQNLVLPNWAYVPANLVVSSGLVMLGRKQGCTWEELGLGRGRGQLGRWMAGSGALVAGAAALAARNRKRWQPFLLDARAESQSPREIIYRSVVRFPLGTALFEEVAFRGVVYGMWRRAGNNHAAAAAVVAGAFGVWHLIPAWRALRGNPLGRQLTSKSSTIGVVFAGAAASGISSFGLTWLRGRSGNLVAPWLTHAAANALGYLAGVDAWRRTAPSPHH